MKNKNLAILFLIISALGFALMSTFVKLAGDVPSMEKALIDISNNTLRSLYGENPPRYVQER